MTLAASCESGNLNPMSFCDQHGAVLLERLRYQRETGRFCDVVIRVHGRQFAAHRNVLAACSPYFDSILKVNVVTKEQVTVNCTNSSAFELLLNYMYSGSVVIDRSSVSDLLKLANNFLITKVKNYCAEYLDRNLDAANCLSVRQLAAKYNLPLLLKAAAEFFDMNINRCLLECVDLLSYSAVQIEKMLKDPKYHNLISPDVHLRLAARWASSNIEHRSSSFRSLLSFCPIEKVSLATLDFVLDYSPLLTKDRPSRLFMLNELARVGGSLGKYSEEYTQLMAVSDPTHLTLGGESERGSERSKDDDEEYMQDEHSENENVVEGEPTGEEILSRTIQPYTLCSANEDSAPVKLKIKLGANKKNKEDRSRRKGEKGRRKRRAESDSEQAGTSHDTSVDDDHIDGVYAFSDEAVLFPEPDGIEPCSIDEDEEEENVPGGQFMCIHCRFATNETEDFNRHTARRHDRNTIFVCTICNEGFEANWSVNFYDHAGQHFDKTSPLRCDLCEYTTEEGMHHLLSHRLSHNSDRPFKCGACGWLARTRSQLWSHERVHSGEASCSCTQCGRAFRRQEALEGHEKEHGEIRNHVCVDCGWSSKSESDLLNHRAASHQVDVYSCHITGCEYVSTKKSQLAAHLRTHLAVRAHECRICHRAFIEKSHVVRHERIHLEDKPFKCESCEYASSRRDKLKEHILKYHNGTTTGKVQVQRRRYRRAKQLAQAIANQQSQARAGTEVQFRPIDSNRERIEAWQNSLNNSNNVVPNVAPNRAFSVAPLVAPTLAIPPPSPGSMSLMNVPLGLGFVDSSLLDEGKDMVLSGVAIGDCSLVTPVPRSPHNHSDPFAMNNTEEGQRPLSLPPYGGNHSWFT